ncbi:hypothetical protein [[Pseudomonas] boreopolis]|uniref:hypothetical protein n=1 Tax=Xanthomonas boreopolis TaxID=86183 RepID=UPI003DA187F6
MAALVQGCRRCALEWFRNDAVAEFGGLTSEEMLRRGQGKEVLVFLFSIASGNRG